MTSFFDPLAWIALLVWLGVLGLFLSLLAALLVSARTLRIRMDVAWLPRRSAARHALHGWPLAAAAAIVAAFVLQITSGETLSVRLVFAGTAGLAAGVLGAWGWRRLLSSVGARIDLMREWASRASAAGEELGGLFEIPAICEAARRRLIEQLGCGQAWLYLRNGDLCLCQDEGAPVLGPDSAIARQLDPSHPARAWRTDELRPLPDEDRAMLARSGIELLVPFSGGLLLLGGLGSGESFRSHDLRFAEAVAGQTALALAAARRAGPVFEQVAEQAHQQASRRSARSTLTHLAPPERLELPDLDVAAQDWLGDEPGGSFFDLVALPNRAAVFFLADIPGPVEEAAIRLVQLQALLRTRARVYSDDLAELLASTRRAIALSSAGRPPIALFCGSYVSGAVLRDDAGGAQILRLAPTDEPLGAASEPFVEREVVLERGDLLAVPSATLPSTRNLAGEAWGEAGMLDAMLGGPARRANERVAAVLDAAWQFSGGGPAQPPRILLMARYQ
jgi:hypothetical protein